VAQAPWSDAAVLRRVRERVLASVCREEPIQAWIIDDTGCPKLARGLDPWGVYDVAANTGCVSLGISNDIAQFSVNPIRRWLDLMGRDRYPGMNQLMITADGGGCNGSRLRLFQLELQRLADETGLTLQVCHHPPGTSKWNKACPRT